MLEKAGCQVRARGLQGTSYAEPGLEQACSQVCLWSSLSSGDGREPP